uniref:Uncharacterized protein n=1 Tax=Heterorhabditis bacteriophora TaxID=37862 RepID=A0A1I7W9C5_HETBA
MKPYRTLHITDVVFFVFFYWRICFLMLGPHISV